MAATYKDIQRETGLSLATISKYFNGGSVRDANRVTIERAARDLGYRVNDIARSLRSQRSMTIGVVLAELNSTFYTTIIAAMEEHLREAGYGTIICNARRHPESESRAIEFLLQKQVDGLVIVPVRSVVQGLDAATDRGIPVVAVDRPIRNGPADAVVIDNRAATAAAVDLLVDAGHTDIALITGPDSWYTMRERRSGFRDAVEQRLGHPPRNEYVRQQPVSIEDGEESMRRLLRLTRPPTAVVCANYELTLGAAIALTELPTGSAPAFVGFDNLDLARVLRPRPSFVVQPVAEIALRAAELILSRIATVEPYVQRTIMLQPQLVVGDEATYRRESP